MVVCIYGCMVLWFYGFMVFFLRESVFIKIKTGRSRQDSLDRTSQTGHTLRQNLDRTHIRAKPRQDAPYGKTQTGLTINRGTRPVFYTGHPRNEKDRSKSCLVSHEGFVLF